MGREEKSVLLVLKVKNLIPLSIEFHGIVSAGEEFCVPECAMVSDVASC